VAAVPGQGMYVVALTDYELQGARARRDANVGLKFVGSGGATSSLNAEGGV
jgi:hypothetical protein